MPNVTTPSSKVRTCSDAESRRLRLSVGETSRLSMTEARFTSSAKDLSGGLFAYRQQRLDSFKDWAAAMRKISSSLVPGGMGISHGKPSGRSAGSGEEPQGSTSTHTS